MNVQTIILSINQDPIYATMDVTQENITILNLKHVNNAQIIAIIVKISTNA